MSPVFKAIRAIVDNPQKVEEVKTFLRGLPIAEKDKEKINSGIELCGNSKLQEGPYEVVTDPNGKSFLEVPTTEFIKIRNLISSQNNISSEYYSPEDTDKLVGLTSQEDSMLSALNNIKDFWHRAFGRRTGLFSWVLSWTFKRFGFSEFEKVEETLNSPSFVQGFAKYYKMAKNESKEKSNAFLGELFKENEPQQKLAKLALKTINIFNKLPEPFVKIFPLIFCIQNVTVPILSKFFFKEGLFSKLLNTLFVVNPWLDEFISSIMGVFQKEIKGTKESLKGYSKTQEDNPNKIEDSSPVNSIVLTSLDKEQYKLKKAVDKVNEAFDRLLGRKNNISSIALNIILRLYGFKDYQDFAERTIKKESFVRNLYKCLEEFSKENQEGGTIIDKKLSEKVKKYFPDSTKEQQKEQQVAKIILAVISMTNNLSEKFVKSGPKIFGQIYSFQYLFMPLVSKFLGNKGFIGKLLGFFAIVNPLVNDFCMDPIATFQEEVLSIRKETESIKHLLPQLPKVQIGNPVNYVVKTAKSVWDSVRNFVQGKFSGKAARVEPGLG
ncbi:MAG: hypothetical protein HY094_08160 [Candidatus Melainabacteria bacterium]|nr:hypothetical protein [Candidatus Melainabacteria bacterium]